MVYNQEADCFLHFIFEQWDSGGHLDLDMSTIVTSLSENLGLSYSEVKKTDVEGFP